jgi:hypothetical protein
MAWQPDYITADELAVYLRIDDDLDDPQLALAVTAASRSIDRHTCRQFGLVAAPEPRQYTARWSKSRCAWLVPVDDLMTTTGLVVSWDSGADGTYATTLSASEFVLRPRNAAAEARPWTEIMIRNDVAALHGTDGEVQGVGRWGWTTTPVAVKQAAQLQASRIFARRDAPFGVAGSPEAGSEMRLLAKVDPDVAVTLDGYRRRVWAR